MKAVWNNAVLANSSETLVVEGNNYFPPTSLNMEFFVRSDKKTICPWKGTASYYDILVDGKVNKDAAWYYPQAKSAASNISGYIAFWKGVQITS